jgi:hypothetical protein
MMMARRKSESEEGSRRSAKLGKSEIPFLFPHRHFFVGSLNEERMNGNQNLGTLLARNQFITHKSFWETPHSVCVSMNLIHFVSYD